MPALQSLVERLETLRPLCGQACGHFRVDSNEIVSEQNAKNVSTAFSACDISHFTSTSQVVSSGIDNDAVLVRVPEGPRDGKINPTSLCARHRSRIEPRAPKAARQAGATPQHSR
jgi:hypothetical protein